MKLYTHPGSTAGRIVQSFAADQGVPLECVIVDLMTGEHLQPAYAALNPNQLVPMLVDGDFKLTESSAILKYLADTVGSSAYPKELRARAHINEVMDWFNSNFYKDFGYGVVYLQVFPHHVRPNADCQAGTIAWGVEKSHRWLKVLDESILGPDRTYLCGASITLADYLGAEMISVGDLIGCTFDAYPNVRRWMGTMRALPTWAAVHAVLDGFAASLRGNSYVAI